MLLQYLFGDKSRPAFRPEPENDRRETVVLVHGLVHRGVLFLGLGRFLARHGYTVYVYDYPSGRRHIPEHGEALAAYLKNVIAAIPADRPLHLVTHSMGGLLSRSLLAAHPEILRRLKRVLMMAPPHHGSPVADWFVRHCRWSLHLYRTIGDLQSGPDSVANRLPYPEIPELGIIIATRDRLVPAVSAHYCGSAQYVTAGGSHRWMMNNAAVRRQVLAFLAEGRFVP